MNVYFLILDCALALNVEQLGDRSYRRREAAHHTIAQLGRLAVPYLQRAQSSPNPEIARRATLLLGPYDAEIADQHSHELMPTEWPRRPWLFLPDTALGYYLSLAQGAMAKTGPPDWPEYREATRLWVRGMLLQRRPREEIRSELDRMAVEERGWIVQNGANYNPPLKLPECRVSRARSNR
jgi:hypothetical protein